MRNLSHQQRKARGWSFDESDNPFSEPVNKRGENGSKGKGYRDELSFCSSCLFTAQWDGPSGFQVINGVLDATDQVANSPDDIAICDNCKCAATNSQVVIASIEGECDLYQGIDILEFTITMADEDGIVDLICPDTTYRASASCESYDMANFSSRTHNAPSNTGLQLSSEGPLISIILEPNIYVYCITVCANPNPPPPPPTSKGKGKSGSISTSPLFTGKSSKYALDDYDPFVDKFPLSR